MESEGGFTLDLMEGMASLEAIATFPVINGVVDIIDDGFSVSLFAVCGWTDDEWTEWMERDWIDFNEWDWIGKCIGYNTLNGGR